MSPTLSTREAARVLGMREDQVRALVRSGLGSPSRRGRRYAFTFQDLVVLRAGHELLQAKVPAARVRRALSALAEQLPPDRPVSGLRIHADGRHVAVREGGTSWNPETGQLIMDFETDELVEAVEELRRQAERLEEPPGALREAEVQFQRGLHLEDVDPAAACDAYGRAIELDPDLVDGYVNLGRIAHEAGRPNDALRFYRQALVRSPDDPVIHFNLALVLEDTQGAEVAVHHYERALALDETFADAHYNLAGLHEQRGHVADAIRHYGAYKRLTQG